MWWKEAFIALAWLNGTACCYWMLAHPSPGDKRDRTYGDRAKELTASILLWWAIIAIAACLAFRECRLWQKPAKW